MGMASQLQIVLFGLLLVFLCHPASPPIGLSLFFMGILASDTAMEEFVQYIQTAHPGTQVLNVDAYNDPHPYHQDLYYQHCDYLPLLNNGTNPAYKTNFLNLQQLVLIGGPDDGVITPWESSQFGFYEDNSETVADMKSQSDSLLPMWDQVNGVQAKIQSFVESAPDGVHMICCSQGKDTVIVTKRSVLYVYSFVAQ
eukprot:Em0013g1065a